MFKLNRLHIAILAACLLGGTAFAAAAAAADPVRIDGHVMAGEGVTHLVVDLTRNGAPLQGALVRIEGRSASELGNGRYVLLVQEPLVAPGKELRVTFAPPALAGHLFEPVSAAAVVVPWIRIAEPADEARVPAQGPPVTIAWKGGAAPFRLTARPEAQPGTYAYDESGITGFRKAIPMSHFRKGQRYLVNVGFDAAQFAFSGPVARGSRLTLIERSAPLHLNVE